MTLICYDKLSIRLHLGLFFIIDHDHHLIYIFFSFIDPKTKNFCHYNTFIIIIVSLLCLFFVSMHFKKLIISVDESFK